MPPIGLGGFFRHGQRYRGGDASAFTAARSIYLNACATGRVMQFRLSTLLLSFVVVAMAMANARAAGRAGAETNR